MYCIFPSKYDFSLQEERVQTMGIMRSNQIMSKRIIRKKSTSYQSRSSQTFFLFMCIAFSEEECPPMHRKGSFTEHLKVVIDFN